MQWTVTSLVQAMMAGSNYGFMLADSAEDTGNNTQTYQSREGTNVPELDLTFG
jgi:Mor family transcriptional regulator